jgi:hypothetical protein
MIVVLPLQKEPTKLSHLVGSFCCNNEQTHARPCLRHLPTHATMESPAIPIG